MKNQFVLEQECRGLWVVKRIGKIDIKIAYLENIESMIKRISALKNNSFEFDTGNVPHSHKGHHIRPV